MNATFVTVEIRDEQDVVSTRQRARQIAAALGLSPQEQTAFATSVSEIARNAFRYAGGGRAEFLVRDGRRGSLLGAVISDRGPGIANLEEILDGRYRSSTGMGLGIIGARRLSEEFDIQSKPGAGVVVTLGVRLPRGMVVTPQQISAVTAELTQRSVRTPMQELQEQNRELMSLMQALQGRQAQVERLNAELAETNRGVLALYAELDQQAASLRRASEHKTRFLSDMTHELRTPLNAMISLSHLLLTRVDGDLTPHQEKQVSLIFKSATALGEMVNDLLDMAKIEAGKVSINCLDFSVADLLAALRGMFRPLFGSRNVALNVLEPKELLIVHSDEQKVSQILRNLVSNAMKFTEQGEVSVTAEPNGDSGVIFRVTDTGIGIAPEDIERIFHDYTQVDGPIQRRVRGTGLGLPLTRKLARLLGGDVEVTSSLGAGSTFIVRLPLSCDRQDNPPETPPDADQREKPASQGVKASISAGGVHG